MAGNPANVSRSEDLGMAFERCIEQRAVLRNQVGVATTGLKEIRDYSGAPAYITAIAHGTLTSIEQLQDEADDAR
jgi:hypothetical protein